MNETQIADVKFELCQALKKHSPEGVEMLLGSIRIIPADDHQTNCRLLSEIIVADIQHRFGG